MAQLIYRDAEDGKLKIGSDSVEAEVLTSVYRSQAEKEIVERDGVFVEVSSNGERILFAVSK